MSLIIANRYIHCDFPELCIIVSQILKFHWINIKESEKYMLLALRWQKKFAEQVHLFTFLAYLSRGLGWGERNVIFMECLLKWNLNGPYIIHDSILASHANPLISRLKGISGKNRSHPTAKWFWHQTVAAGYHLKILSLCGPAVSSWHMVYLES